MNNYVRRVGYHVQRFGPVITSSPAILAELKSNPAAADHMLTPAQRRRLRKHDRRALGGR